MANDPKKPPIKNRYEPAEVLPKEQELKPSGSATPPRPMNAQEAEPPVPGFSQTAREKILTMIEREGKLEMSERGMMLDIMGKLAIAEADKNRLLEIYDKSRQREGARRNDFEQSQRQYMWFMMADKERDMGHIQAMTTAFVALSDAYGAMKQTEGKSKVGEIMEVVAAFAQIPLFAALQEMVLERLSRKKPLKDKTKNKKRAQLLREIAALEKEEEAQDEGEE